MVAAFVFSTLATLAVEYAFITHDYSPRYVWRNSSSQQPLIYRITALWGGMDGSLLFWLWLLTGCGLLVTLQAARQRERLVDFALVSIAVTECQRRKAR